MANGNYPDWFEFNPQGPHQRSGGWHPEKQNYAFYCTKDGERWPCADERERERHEQEMHQQDLRRLRRQ